MIVRVHGFDWQVYTERVMPAFAHWLIDGDETPVHQLYSQTRSAREEHFLPPAMQPACNWPRAQAFVKLLPRGSYTRREYRIICDAEQFTDLSDRYIHRHPPQLYQHSEALRAIWGALVEEYCQSWFTLPGPGVQAEISDQQNNTLEQKLSRSEVVSLLHTAGLNELAHEISGQAPPIYLDNDHLEDEDEVATKSQGVALGHHPTSLHLRGWLATISVRAMALFELLACERRSMPFGYQAGEPYDTYAGYLTSDEVWQMAACLRSVEPPEPAKAKEDYERFRLQQSERSKEFRVFDEVLPTHADAFLKVVRMAAQYGLGLVCSLG